MLTMPHKIDLIDDTYQVDDDADGLTDYNFNNPDFSFVQFNSNLVLRWEYIPGSELFWFGLRGQELIFQLQKVLLMDFKQGFWINNRKNIFLIKATYRFIL